MTTCDTLFFTVASGDYEFFAAPFAASALAYNDDVAVEVVVDSAAAYEQRYGDAVGVLTAHFPDRIFFREGRPPEISAPKARFLMEPAHKAEYVYISDVDILFLERNVSAVHRQKMKESGSPYSNIQRPDKPRLSGLHFTRWDSYYPIEKRDLALASIRSDEAILYKLVGRRGLLPAPNLGRPLHGIHMSPNRDVVVRTEGVIHWGATVERWEEYKRFASTELWTSLRPHLGDEFLRVLDRLERACRAAFE